MSETTVEEAKTVDVVRDVTKKGRSSWQPARFLQVKGKDPAYNYRWCVDNPENLAKKELEGWDFVDTTKEKLQGIRPDGIDMGKSLDSRMRARGHVLMKMPKETVEARKEYYAKKVDETIETIRTDASGSIRKEGAKPYGTLKIS